VTVISPKPALWPPSRRPALRPAPPQPVPLVERHGVSLNYLGLHWSLFPASGRRGRAAISAVRPRGQEAHGTLQAPPGSSILVGGIPPFLGKSAAFT
jgi:hypothetical protein